MDYFIYYLYGISKYILQNVYAIFGLHLAFFYLCTHYTVNQVLTLPLNWDLTTDSLDDI